MLFTTDAPWQRPQHPDKPWLWPVSWVAAGERSRRDKPKPLPYRQHRYPDGIRVVCADLAHAGHVDVMLSGRAAWAYLGRTEDDAHGEQPDRLVELDWQNPPLLDSDLPMATVILLTLPDGAGYVAVAQEWLAHHTEDTG